MADNCSIIFTMLMMLMLWSAVNTLETETECIANETSQLIHCLETVQNITLKPGVMYEIEQNITNMNGHTHIEGNGATLKCAGENVGFTFLKKIYMTIRNLTISSCGAEQMSSSSDHSKESKLNFEVALYIGRSSHVDLQHVIITNSTGYGLALVNCRSSVTIRDSKFQNSHSGERNLPGGGGVYIEQTEAHEKVHFDIQTSAFINNNASTGTYKLEDYPVYQSDSTFFLFGRGGGLSINLKANFTHFSVRQCLFESNVAHRGAGLFVYFLNGSHDNSVSITDSNFTANNCTVQKLPESVYSAGGGLAVLYLSHTNHSSFTIQRCNFTRNVAYYGGGVSVGTMKSQDSNTFLLEGSNFLNNSGKIGSAMDLFCYSIVDHRASQCTVTPNISNTHFEQNSGYYFFSSKRERTYTTMHVEDQRVQFSGKTSIIENMASGIGLEDSIIELMPNASILLMNNTARNGGGLLVSGDSEVQLHRGIQLTITGNMATERGGGIFVKQTEHFFSVYSYTCFIRYNSNDTDDKDHPNAWEVNITLRDNTAKYERNAIFATSIYPCVWPGNDTQDDIMATFCDWTSWHFENDNCSTLIKTLPQNFSQDNYQVDVYPNDQTLVKEFDTLDDLNHVVTNDSIFIASVLDMDDIMEDIHRPVMTSNRIQVNGTGGENLKILVQTAYHRTASTTLHVTVMECPAGHTIINITSGRCECTVNSLPMLFCAPDLGRYRLRLFIGHCMGYDQNLTNGTFVVSKCPFTATQPLHAYVNIMPSSPSSFNEDFCIEYNRTGLLCQDCSETYGIDIFSPTYQCIPCNNSMTYINWLKAVGAVVGPQTLFFFAVVIFHIGITAPSMTGYIFFSHVIALPLEVITIQSAWTVDLNKPDNPNHTKYSRLLTDLAISPYRIWSFDYPEILHVSTCIKPSLKIMHAIAFRYLHALYPILLLASALVVIELHARNCKPITYLWKPLCYLCVRFRRKWDIKTSVIDAFATVILLSYSKVINTSLYLLAFNYVRDIQNYGHIQTKLDYDTSVAYLEGQHIIFASIAIFMLFTLGMIPPLLLLLYPNRYFFRLLNKTRLGNWRGLHVFVETFHGSFKNRANGSPERRWFAGLYFIFRIIVFLVFVFTEDFVNIYYNLAVVYTVFTLLLVFFKPYKKDRYTNLDACFMGILIIVNTSVVYCASNLLATGKLPTIIWRATYVLLHIPTMYLIAYLIYLLFTRSRSALIQKYFMGVRRIKQKTVAYFGTNQKMSEDTFSSESDYHQSLISEGVTHSSLDSFSDAPDRVNNPQRYLEWSGRWKRCSSSEVSVDREKDRKELTSQQELTSSSQGDYEELVQVTGGAYVAGRAQITGRGDEVDIVCR